MREITKEDLEMQLNQTIRKERLDLKEIKLLHVDLSGWNLQNIDFTGSDFQEVILDGADMTGSSISKGFFKDCSLRRIILQNANVHAAVLRYCNLSGANIKGADMSFANLEHANLKNIIYDDDTKYFKLHCPEKGAFIAWKKCVDFRMVQLLIPADALRTSATLPTCRCSKAKVLSIHSIDYKESYEWACSFVDENFIYKVGEIAEVKDFNQDRWMDSTTGIHFFMTREEAIAY
ncbi:MAG: pentapeptide repeat-containing protein [Lachnospiraceae bacterium]